MTRRSLSLMVISVLGVAALWVVASSTTAAAGGQAAYVAKGRRLFVQHCASCHGEAGKGQGPVAAAMKQGPPDLTAIKGPGEKFPFARVAAVIDGEKEVIAHGPRKMPVWGTIFKRSEGEALKEASIYSIAKYIESIQTAK
ncbi:MAG TPA: cytochrome c [Blastocatellia bacterium]|nr:cytochrome c [Blastocatellia bacterium]